MNVDKLLELLRQRPVATRTKLIPLVVSSILDELNKKPIGVTPDELVNLQLCLVESLASMCAMVSIANNDLKTSECLEAMITLLRERTLTLTTKVHECRQQK